MSLHGRRSIPHSIKKIVYDTTEHRNDSSHDHLPPGANIMPYVTWSGGEELKPKCLLSIERLQYSHRIRDQLSLEPDTRSYCLDISSLTVAATSK
jgi:hypothetical protein